MKYKKKPSKEKYKKKEPSKRKQKLINNNNNEKRLQFANAVHCQLRAMGRAVNMAHGSWLMRSNIQPCARVPSRYTLVGPDLIS